MPNSEMFNDETTKVFFNRIQTGSSQTRARARVFCDRSQPLTGYWRKSTAPSGRIDVASIFHFKS